MKRFVTVKSLILVVALLLGSIQPSAAERPFASNGNGLAPFITDGAGNVVGATVVVTGNGTHLGLFTGNGTIQFIPDANDPNISHAAGEVTYIGPTAIVFRRLSRMVQWTFELESRLETWCSKAALAVSKGQAEGPQL